MLAVFFSADAVQGVQEKTSAAVSSEGLIEFRPD
jgi:hypothetical protein